MSPRTMIVLAAALLVCGCGSRARNAPEDAAAAPSNESAGSAPSAPKVDALAARGMVTTTDSAAGAGAPAAPATAAAMLIRTGTASVEVDSLDRAVARVRALAQQIGGYVASSTVQGGREQAREASLEVKIPSAKWDQALSGLNPIGRVESVNVKSEDVGEEFVDVQARVANARRLEERLIGLLTARTGKLEEVLQVERELARVREEIERYEGRLRYLSSRAAVSTLTVDLHEPRPLVGGYPGASVLGRAFRDAWRNFIGFLAGLISSLGFLVPIALIVAAIWWAVRRLRRRRPAPKPAEKPRLEE
jgi:hypothetical protein